MTPRTLARAIAAGRVGFGLALLAIPERAAGPWLGPDDAARPGTGVALRGLGARDLALGMGTLTAADGALPAWVAASVLGDLGDLVATATTTSLPRPGRVAVSALAGSAVALGAVAFAGLTRS